MAAPQAQPVSEPPQVRPGLGRAQTTTRPPPGILPNRLAIAVEGMVHMPEVVSATCRLA